MNIQELLKKLKTETNGDPESVEGRKTKEGHPYIFVDDFVIHESNDSYVVKDTREEMEQFATSSENVLEFFKGFYDACCTDYDESLSNEFYDKGWNAVMDLSPDDIEEEGEDDDEFEDLDGEEVDEEQDSDDDENESEED